MLQRSCVWFFVFCVFTCLLFYTKFEDQHLNYSSTENYNIPTFISYSENNRYFIPKKVVAYSLIKMIESQGRETNCSQKIDFSMKRIRTRIWKQVEDTNVYTYTSYYDVRLKPYKYIRIIATRQGSANSTLYCHMDNNNDVTITEASIQDMWYKEWDPGDQKTYTPILISCKIPQHQKTFPKYVAISSKPCQETKYRLKIIDNLKTKQDSDKQSVIICVKPLNFKVDITLSLLSWLELNKLLGVDKFDVYLESVDVKTRKLLNWCIKNGIMKTFKHKTVTLTGSVWQRRKYEVVTYNDCLYRNIHKYDFILPLDIDEIIIPRSYNTFQQLITNVINTTLVNKFSSFSARNTYFYTNLTNNNETIRFLKHLTRSDFSPSKKSGKSLISTSNTLVAFNHYTLIPLKPGVGRVYFIPKNYVQLNHYKKSCFKDLLPECQEIMYNTTQVYDPTVLRYKDNLRNNVKNIIQLIKR